jgi:AraC family transcriptional regulator, positive regulator of tynA and feaB
MRSSGKAELSQQENNLVRLGTANSRFASTDDVQEHERIDYWRSICGGLLGTFELEDYTRRDFSSRIEVTTVGDLKIGSFHGVSQTFNRSDRHLESDTCDDYLLLLESNKTHQCIQGDHTRTGTGGMVLIDIKRQYRSAHREGLDVVGFFLPRETIERLHPRVRHCGGVSIDASHSSFPVVACFLRAMAEHGAFLSFNAATRMASIAIDIIGSTFAGTHGQADATRNASLLWRAQAYISQHLEVSGLTLQDVSGALKVSLRRLHQVAADEGISLVDWMWERRLLRARSLLVDAPNHVSIQLVASRCGFVDQAHFSRRFKQRFGLAPSELRRTYINAVGSSSRPLDDQQVASR